MKTRLTSPSASAPTPDGFPDADSLAALRAWYAGLPAREAVQRYLCGSMGERQSARGILGRIRRQLVAVARGLHRDDLAILFGHPVAERIERAKAVTHAIGVLRLLPAPEPQISDDIERWFPARTGKALRAHGIDTLADLTVRIPRRRQWWKAVPGLGAASARRIEAFFAAYPALTERARALITASVPGAVVPWESLRLPHQVDGSSGAFRAPRHTCTLDANNDYAAVQALRAREKQWTSAGALKMLESAVCGVSIRSAEKVDRSTVCVSIFHRRFRMVGSPIKPGVRPCQSVSNHRASRVHFAGLRPPLTHSAVSQNHDRMMGHYAG
ncbi:phage integrase family protein [Paraburkholderia sp. MPAMCS5]|uniref:phage integrase family protein n=1 Tax=Paraburkholderia sp. MPAMCS5 TaxID=3112563 RepID=UPI003FA6F054